jgi:GTP-binding protein
VREPGFESLWERGLKKKRTTFVVITSLCVWSIFGPVSRSSVKKLSAAQSHREKGITHHRLATFAIIAAMTPPFSVPSMSFSSSRTSRTGLSAVNAKNAIIEGKSKKLLRPTLKKFFVAAAASSGKSEWDNETGTVYYVEEELFSNKQNRPVLRTGAEAQTLPLPDISIVSDKKLQKVRLTSSVENERDCPPENGLPEIALIGRSNVGKSSLLNMLTEGTSHAIVSANPGTTRSINHYLIDAKWYIVDLPGYGFAKATEEEILSWDTFAKNYFKTRQTLCGVLLLIDASIETQDKDLDYANYLIGNDIPFTIVFTKCDRKKKGPNTPTVEENIEALENRLEETWHRLPSIIKTSSVSKEGRGDILKFISSIILFRRRANAEKKENKRRLKARNLKERKYKEKTSKTKMRQRPLKKNLDPDGSEVLDAEIEEENKDEEMFRKEVEGLSERTKSILAQEIQEIRRGEK